MPDPELITITVVEVEAIASFSVFRKGQIYAVLSDDPMLKTGYLRRLDAPVADTSGGGAAVPASGDLDLGGRPEVPEEVVDGPVESEPSGDAGDEGEGGTVTGVVSGQADEDAGQEVSSEKPVASARKRKTKIRPEAE